MDHLQTVAAGFRILGVALGIPSTLAFLCLMLVWMQLQVPTPPPAMPGESQSLITVLMAGARLFGRIFSAAAEVSRWVLSIMAAVALGLSVVSAAMYFTGRGLQQHQIWARLAAALLAAVLLALSSLGVLSFRRGVLFVLPALILAGSGYTLWTLLRRFS